MTPPRRLVPLALAAALGPASPAAASQVDYDPASLAELLAPVRSGHAALALVKVGTPAATPRVYPVPGDGEKRCEPYAFVEYHATIERVVTPARPGSGAHAPPAVGDALAIVPADTPELVDLTRRACLEGVSKSPIFRRFAGETPTDGARLLVVVTWVEGYGWTELVDGAWLAAGALPAIEKALAKPAP